MQNFNSFILENKNTPTKFMEFAQARHDGAKKISDSAKEKGGHSMLTYYHFVVKLPYYKEAASGKFDMSAAKRELKEQHQELNTVLKEFEARDQIPFQKIMGKIEVLGELIINWTKYNK
jgi:hypothetical protein